MDPLTSYFDAAVVNSSSGIRVIKDFFIPDGFYLFDSLSKRNTNILVEKFKEKKTQNAGFRKAISTLNMLNDLAVTQFLDGEDLTAVMQAISQLQLEWFTEMIPSNVEDVWRQGLSSDKYFMKLSGAGGGGFFLLYAKKRPDITSLIGL